MQEIRRRDYDEGRQMRAALHAKAIADEQRKRDLFHASHQVPRGSPPGSPLASRYGGDKGGDVARFLPKPPALTPIGSPSHTALPTRQSEVRRAPPHPRPYPPPLPSCLATPPRPPPLPTRTQRPACSLQP